jgi:hypothetical protein
MQDVSQVAFDNPNLSGTAMPRFTRDQTNEKIEVDKDRRWLAFSSAHAVISMLCENRTWSGRLLLKGKAYPRLEVREVYASEVDDHRYKQRYRVIMFGLGCPEDEANTVRIVWDRYQRWRHGLLCWDHDEYQKQLAIVTGHAQSLQQLNDAYFAGHTSVIGTPIEGETFGQGSVLQKLAVVSKPNERGIYEQEVHTVKPRIVIPGTWGLRNS